MRARSVPTGGWPQAAGRDLVIVAGGSAWRRFVRWCSARSPTAPLRQGDADRRRPRPATTSCSRDELQRLGRTHDDLDVHLTVDVPVPGLAR